MPATEQARALRAAGITTEAEVHRLCASWRAKGRPAQQEPPGSWRTWLLLAGRGFGKTRAAVEWVHRQAITGAAGRIAIVGRTAADMRDTAIDGPSGFLAVTPSPERPKHEPSKRRLTWPNGAIAITYSAEEPDQLRGPNHDAAWADELAAWTHPEAWDQLQFGLRLGEARCVVTTTPRPTPAVRAILKASGTVVTRGSTYDNRANLAPRFFDEVVSRYEGTRLGRQELHAELLEDTPGALWTTAMIDAARVTQAPALRRVVVAIDPAVTSHDGSDETGLVVAALGEDGHGYVLEDASGRYSPDAWARKAIALYDRHHADRIVAETNNGGEMVALTLRAAAAGRHIPYRAVHASRGKRVRAEPVAALYEQGRVHHVGALAALEDQLTTWDATSSAASPDRLDALVWALTELMLNDSDETESGYLYR